MSMRRRAAFFGLLLAVAALLAPQPFSPTAWAASSGSQADPGGSFGEVSLGDGSKADDDLPLGDLPIDMGAISDEVQQFEEETYTVTAGMVRQRVIDTPSAVFVLRREEIEALCPQDLGDLLVAIPGLDVFRVADRLYYGGPAGFTRDFSKHFLIMLDGVPYSSARAWADEWATMPVALEDIEQIEYVSGSQSTQHGPFAAMGVVNIITRRAASDTWRKDKPSSINFSSGSRGFGRHSISVNSRTGRSVISGWANFRQSDGFGAPSYPLGTPLVTGIDADESRDRMAGVSVRQDLDARRSVRFDLGTVKSDYQGFHPFVIQTPNFKRSKDLLRLLYSDAPTADEQLTLSLKVQRDRLEVLDPIYQPLGDNRSKARYGDILFQVRKTRPGHNGRRYSTGAFYERLTGHGIQLAPGDHELRVASTYGLVEIPMNKRDRLFLGLNFTHDSANNNDQAIKISAHRRLGKKEALRLGYGTGMQLPDLRLLNLFTLNTFSGIPLNTPLFAGTPNLVHERIRMAEAGYEKHWKRSSLRLDLFHGHIDDRIVLLSTIPLEWDFGGGITSPLPSPYDVNGTELLNDPRRFYLRGGILSIERKLTSKVKFRCSYRHTDAWFSDGTKPRLVPRNLSILHLTLTPGPAFTASVLLRTVSSYAPYDDVALASIADIKGYSTVDLALRKKLGRKKDRSVWLRVTNLMDKNHHEAFILENPPPVGAVEIGRTVVVGAQLQF